MATRKNDNGAATDPEIAIERVYDHPSGSGEGFRVFVDRLWPRGMRKDAFHFDDWEKNLAPSTELRHWYAHDVARFDEFRTRYLDELSGEQARASVDRIRDLADGRPLVLLTATRDVEHSNAEVLADYLRRHLDS